MKVMKVMNEINKEFYFIMKYAEIGFDYKYNKYSRSYHNVYTEDHKICRMLKQMFSHKWFIYENNSGNITYKTPCKKADSAEICIKITVCHMRNMYDITVTVGKYMNGLGKSILPIPQYMVDYKLVLQDYNQSILDRRGAFEYFFSRQYYSSNGYDLSCDFENDNGVDYLTPIYDLYYTSNLYSTVF